MPAGANTRGMDPMTCAALLLVFCPRPMVPPAALPEAVEATSQRPEQPAWVARLRETWQGPSIVRPDLYDHRYIAW
jgi:hypothetical protein